MLKHFKVKNYALIDELDIEWSAGFNTITGETGAGKSILLGALGLIIGQRADTQVLSDKEKKCIVEADIDVSKYDIQDFFTQNELDYQAETIIRREILPSGSSRAFINDTPVTLQQLKELGASLIDIHSQHQTLTLANSNFQLAVIDAVVGDIENLSEYKKLFKQYKKHQQELEELTELEKNLKRDFDYFNFQFNELEEAKLESINQQELEQELDTMNNAEAIKLNLSKALVLLDDGEISILTYLNEIKSLLGSFANQNNQIKELSQRVNSSLIEIKDITKEIEGLQDDIAYSPDKIIELNTHLDTLYRLQKKHQVNSTEELVAIKNDLELKVQKMDSLDEEITKLKKLVDSLYEQLSKMAKVISAGRKKVIPAIENEVHTMLESLSMKNARLQIELSNSGQLSDTGSDKIKFLFSANKGGELKELGKVASGGELSRLMLCIKAITARSKALPTIIFDEIDTGVSGDVADKIGIILTQMGKQLQVITITHLPQIAGKGKSHYFVYKNDEGDKTRSHIKKLGNDERVLEIAKMLSNDNPTEAALNNARELIAK